MGSQQSTSRYYGSQSIPGYSYPGSYVDFERSSSLQSRYTTIGDNYSSLEQVQSALALAGLESSNLIIGIDFTKSNEWTGTQSFNGRSMHHLGDSRNPYEQAISIIGKTLSAFDDDNLIPCYGFGDVTTHDKEVFSFNPDDSPCNGFEEVLSRYRELVPQVRLSGPTSFAPIIETAIGIVDNSGGQYHVLMIIADGQVTRSEDTSYAQISLQEQNTIDAIVKASNYPLSIVLVGVGDGPWDLMTQFDDNIRSRAFDNFQFVNFTEIMSRHAPTSNDVEFARAALMEIPSQYKATIDLQLLSCPRGTPRRIPVPPPSRNYSSATSYPMYSESTGFDQITGFQYAPAHHPIENFPQNKNCPVCRRSTKNLAFGCGHQTCYDCGRDVNFCPICQTHITTMTRLCE